MYPRLLFIVLFALSIVGQTMAQEQKATHDSIKNIQDSLMYQTTRDSSKYKAIEEYSEKSKFARFIHRLIFKPISRATVAQPKKSKTKRTPPKPRTEGKIIRNINITTLDPFGYSIGDTSIHPEVFWMKAGNSVHFKTRAKIIKNLLLFKENEPYDSLLAKESERLIRSRNYVRSVLINTKLTSRKGDSVDVYIRALDVWSIIPAFGMTSSTLGMGLSDLNFAGLGSSLRGHTLWNRPTGENITRFSYLIPNIRNSYISFNLQYLFSTNTNLLNNAEFKNYFYSLVSSNAQYSFSGNRNMIKSIEFTRSFYSATTQWAGGIFLGQMLTTQSYIRNDTVRYLKSLTNIQDYWIARSWQLYKRNTADGRITSFILSGRVLKTRNPARPPEAVEANIFNNVNLYFAGIGITSRKYLQDKYIFNYGLVEDVPLGSSFGITVGLDILQKNRIYLGFNAAMGNYYSFGYLSTHLEYGTFKGSTGFQQGVVTGRINYYTRLLNLGNWKIRQFVRPALIFGINRLPSDNLTIREGLKGFEGQDYSGTRMMIITLQTQSYSPWNLAGFHFGPYLFSSFGMPGNDLSGFKNSRLYSLLGFGMLIRNDYLVFNTFQISMTFYPYVPGRGYNIFRTNAYKTSDYGFRNFEISKPGVVEY